MEAMNPDYRSVVKSSFEIAAFVTDVGIVMLDCGPGWCETTLTLLPRHLQHTGSVHAGAQTTMADHTGGAAAVSLIREGDAILTAEFKMTFIRTALGESLWCRAQVVKPGRNMTFVESEVYAVNDGKKVLVSKLSATMAVVAMPNRK